MTTLTRDRSVNLYGDDSARITLSVSGPAGAVAVSWYGKDGRTLGGDLAWHSHETRGGYDLFDECPILGGPCYSDTAGSKTRQRVLDAWDAGGDAAAYAVLEELYREEFGA